MIRHLRLWQYANLNEAECDFLPGANALVGPNGSGKTNILGAVACLGLGKNPFKSADKDAIAPNNQQWALTGNFESEEGATEKVHLFFQLPATKQIKVNDVSFGKISQWPGHIPIVVAAPDDSFVLNEASEERRRFIDMFLCQINLPYLEDLTKYKKLLVQRNALLKQGKERGDLDLEVLEVLDYQIKPLLAPIQIARQKALELLEPALEQVYFTLSMGAEIPKMELETNGDLNIDPVLRFTESQRADIAAGRSLVGPHRDDLAFYLKDMPLKRYGSQGQNKSFVLALKLAQIQCLKNQLKRWPLILLDDVFDKLDELRIKQLLKILSQSEYPQFILTDARPERTASLLGSDCKVHKIANGRVIT